MKEKLIPVLWERKSFRLWRSMDTLELLRLSREGDKSAKDRLVCDNTPLVYSVVRRFVSWGYDINDLFQIGVIGLIKAIDKFDFSYDVKFSTYAVPMISGEVKRFLRDDGIIKVSRTIKDNIRLLDKTREQYIKEFGSEPTISYLCENTGISREDILIAMEAKRPVESMAALVGSEDSKNQVSYEEIIPDKVDYEKKLIDKMTVKSLLGELKENERKIIELRYFAQMTQTQIAGKLGLSQVQVSRMEKKILLKLRNML